MKRMIGLCAIGAVFAAMQTFSADEELFLKNIKKYTIGQTTLDEFLEDGWDYKSVFIGKVGIVSFVRKDGDYYIVLGECCGRLSNSQAEMMQRVFDAETADGGDVAIHSSSYEDRASDEPLDMTHRQCNFTFKNNLLTEKQCGF